MSYSKRSTCVQMAEFTHVHKLHIHCYGQRSCFSGQDGESKVPAGAKPSRTFKVRDDTGTASGTSVSQSRDTFCFLLTPRSVYLFICCLHHTHSIKHPELICSFQQKTIFAATEPGISQSTDGAGFAFISEFLRKKNHFNITEHTLFVRYVTIIFQSVSAMHELL